MTRRRFDDDNIDQFCLFTLRLKTPNHFQLLASKTSYRVSSTFFYPHHHGIEEEKEKNYEIFHQKFFAGSQKHIAVQKT